MDKLKNRVHIIEQTAEYIKAKTGDTKPGAYAEQP